jgi:hypothetical protein
MLHLIRMILTIVICPLLLQSEVQGRRSVDYGSPRSSNMRLPYYTEGMAVAYAKTSSPSCMCLL